MREGGTCRVKEKRQRNGKDWERRVRVDRRDGKSWEEGVYK